MKLVTWNVAGRQRQLDAQVAALAALEADVVALQEVTATTLPRLRSALAAVGLPSAIDSLAAADPAREPRGPRRYGQLTASRFPLRPLAVASAVPWPERLLSVEVTIAGRAVEVHNAHVPPGSSNGWAKVRMLEGIHTAFAAEAATPRVLCGDFNAPQAEPSSGGVVTWAQRWRRGGWTVVGTLRGGPGAAWDAAERSVVEGLAAHDLADVYRRLHGPAPEAFSWCPQRRGGVVVRRRFDHIFASASLCPLECEYIHSVREGGLSDHAALAAVFDWPTARAVSRSASDAQQPRIGTRRRSTGRRSVPWSFAVDARGRRS